MISFCDLRNGGWKVLELQGLLSVRKALRCCYSNPFCLSTSFDLDSPLRHSSCSLSVVLCKDCEEVLPWRSTVSIKQSTGLVITNLYWYFVSILTFVCGVICLFSTYPCFILKSRLASLSAWWVFFFFFFTYQIYFCSKCTVQKNLNWFNFG